MRALVLGSAAGGGFPQWNCRCDNCRLAWSGDPRVQARTQSSLALSADGVAWVLVNASPDLRQQILATPALHPRAKRESPIGGVLLTNADIDHVAGLLTLRERQPFVVLGSEAALDAIAAESFKVLDPAVVARETLSPGETIDLLGLRVESFAVPGKVPLYRETATVEIGLTGGETVGLDVAAGGRRLVVIPGCAEITDAVLARVEGADALVFDGTTFTDDEMIAQGLSAKTARRMGHVPMSGPGGSLERFAKARVGQKIYAHVNNSNPVLREDSVERATVVAAGWTVAWDGMEIAL